MTSIAIDIATSGYLSGNPLSIANSGYIISFRELTKEEVIIVNNDANRYANDIGVGSIIGGISSYKNTKVIEVIFDYKGHKYTQIKTINSNLYISMENLDIEVINNEPTVVIKTFEKLGKNGKNYNTQK